jgi:hypothetical protein
MQQLLSLVPIKSEPMSLDLYGTRDAFPTSFATIVSEYGLGDICSSSIHMELLL